MLSRIKLLFKDDIIYIKPDQRIRTGFIYIPKTISNKTVCFEIATWEEVCIELVDYNSGLNILTWEWIPTKWIN